MEVVLPKQVFAHHSYAWLHWNTVILVVTIMLLALAHQVKHPSAHPRVQFFAQAELALPVLPFVVPLLLVVPPTQIVLEVHHFLVHKVIALQV
jgi:hypothetical protein